MSIAYVMFYTVGEFPAFVVVVGEHENRLVAGEQARPLAMLLPRLNTWYCYRGDAAVIVESDRVQLAFADSDEAQLVCPVHSGSVVKPRRVRRDVLLMRAGFDALVRLPELKAYHSPAFGHVGQADHPGILPVFAIPGNFAYAI